MQNFWKKTNEKASDDSRLSNEVLNTTIKSQSIKQKLINLNLLNS